MGQWGSGGPALFSHGSAALLRPRCRGRAVEAALLRPAMPSLFYLTSAALLRPCSDLPPG